MKYDIEWKSQRTGQTGRWGLEMTKAEAEAECAVANDRFSGWLDHTVVEVENGR